MSTMYPPYEPGGSEPKGHRWRRIKIATVTVLAFVGLGACAALVVFPQRTAAKSLDPAINEQTGLPDGKYLMIATATFHRDGECWFRGNPQGSGLSATSSPEVTVYGAGDIQCAGSTYGQVLFTVSAGAAKITKSNL
jgi:hypothetical protein